MRPYSAVNRETKEYNRVSFLNDILHVYKINKNILSIQSDANNHNVYLKDQFTIRNSTRALPTSLHTILSSPRLPVKRNEFWQVLATARLRWSRDHSWQSTGSLWRVVVRHTCIESSRPSRAHRAALVFIFISPQTDTSQSYKTTDTRLVLHVVCPFTP